MTIIINPFQLFLNQAGTALNAGKIYIGVAGLDPQTNPVVVYWDEAQTIVASQPLATIGGYITRSGTPARVYGPSSYSIRARDKSNVQVFYQATVTDEFSSTIPILPVTPGEDITTIWNTAAATGEPLTIMAGSYYASALIAGADGQCFTAIGNVQIYKNADGALFSSSHSFLQFSGFTFNGDGHTGDNILCTGNDLRMLNCTSQHAAGRALKATGAHTIIDGGLYQTSDATASGYDIELGVSDSNPELYHQIKGVRTSQSTGGLLLTDAGGHCVSGGQIGKLTIQSPTSPGGTAGGQYTGVRIIGNVSIGVPNATFTSCEFGGTTVTLLAGITGTSIGLSNIFEIGCTLVDNSGNFNNSLIQNSYNGGSGGIRQRFGGNASLAELGMSPTTGQGNWAGSWTAPNTKVMGILQTTGSVGSYFTCDASNNGSVNLGSTTAFGVVGAGSGGVYTQVSGVTKTQVTATELKPTTDNAITCGSAALAWAGGNTHVAFAVVSDARAKEQVLELDEAEIRVAVRCKALPRKYKLIAEVEALGADAKWHFGVIAQDVIAAFEAEGLDALDYSVVKHTIWEAQGETTREIMDPETGEPTGEIEIVTAAREGGDRYTVCYEELYAFMWRAP